MQFQWPVLWAGTAVAVTILGVVLAYLIKKPARARLVSSLLVWRLLIDDDTKKRQRRRWLVSLLTSMLIALLATLALVGLQERHARRGLVLVVDNSVTMLAHGIGQPSRFEKAVRAASDLVASSSGPFWVADSTGSFGYTRASDPASARALLAELGVVPGRRPLLPPPPLDAADAARHLFTDGLSLDAVSGGFEIHSVYSPVDNAGIVAAEARSLRGETEVFAEIVLASPRRQRVLFEVFDTQETQLARQNTELDPGERWALTFSPSNLKRAAGGQTLDLLELRVSLPGGSDGMDLDNSAWVAISAPDATEVVYVGAPGTPTQRALSASSSLRIVGQYSTIEQAPAEVPPKTSSGPVWVFDHTAPGLAPQSPALLLSPPKRPWFAENDAQSTTATKAEATRTSQEVTNVAPKTALPAGRPGADQSKTTQLDPERLGFSVVRGAGWIAWMSDGDTVPAYGADAEFPVLLEQTVRRLARQPTVDSVAAAEPEKTAGSKAKTWRLFGSDGKRTRFSPADLLEPNGPGYLRQIGTSDEDSGQALVWPPLGDRASLVNLRTTPNLAATMNPGRPLPWATIWILSALLLLVAETWLRHRGHLE